MEAVARRARVPVVTVTGSESTGKTTLAGDLARYYRTVWVPEFARAYADDKMARLSETLDARDVEPIARGQIALEDRTASEANGLLVLDTDVVSTVVYARHYYGDCPAWIEVAARERRADLYLLCDIDVPWIPDSVRDRPGDRRQIHSMFVAELDALGAHLVLISGSWQQRQDTAIAAVRHLVRSREKHETGLQD